MSDLTRLSEALQTKNTYVKQPHRIDQVLKAFTFTYKSVKDSYCLYTYFGTDIKMQSDRKSNVSIKNNKVYILQNLIKNSIDHFNLSLCERCFNNCSYCFYNKTDPLPTDKQIDTFLTWLSKQTYIKTITIMGGEPTLCTRLNDIIQKIKSSNITPRLLTSNIEYVNIHNIEVVYHFVKEIESNKITTIDNKTYTFDEYKVYANSIQDTIGLSQAVITPSNVKYVKELEPYMEFRIQTDRKGNYLISKEQIVQLPESILKREIKFYIDEVINNAWITYNLATDTIYNSSDRPYLGGN